MKFADRKQFNNYFKDLLASMEETRIKAVYVLPLGTYSTIARQRIYDVTEMIIIRFEDDTNWIIRYNYINSFEIEIRPLNEEEQQMLDEDTLGDCFNNELEIKDKEGVHVEKIHLEYSRLERVEAQPMQFGKERWQNGDIVEVMPSEDNFDQIVFKMDNSKSFRIYPGNPSNGGDMRLTSDDSVDRQGEGQVLSRGQELLAEYFYAIGMKRVEVIYAAMLVWEEEATREMLQYLLDTHDTDIEHIMKVASELSIKYPLPDDEDE